jgi:hypothetical protein
MKWSRSDRGSGAPWKFPRCVLLFALGSICFSGALLEAQDAPQATPASPANVAEQIQKLTQAMAQTQAQLEQSQRQLQEMQKQLEALQQQVAKSNTAPAPNASPTPTAAATTTVTPAPVSSSSLQQVTAAIDDLKEHQALQDAEIATHEQTKVETESKYSVKLSGLILLNTFINTQRVDMPATPTMALQGSGSTGISIRQTVLGLDARGPHLWGARSHADLRIDFNGNVQSANAASTSSYAYTAGSTLLRLRTAHAALDWKNTEAFFSLDRPIFSPDYPSSLVALAEPALAWSGNLWAWNPQLGVTHDVSLGGTQHLRLQAALIDPSDAPVSFVSSSSAYQASGDPGSTSERSRWPGTEARIALVGSKLDEGAHIGFGGYFAPHRIASGQTFDSWASTLDYHVPLGWHLDLTGSVYHGEGLGGLGGGAYKDYAYLPATSGPGDVQALHDTGGWTQLKEKAGQRLEFNAAFGVDELLAHELRPYAGPYSAIYQDLARNRTYTGNVIYSPSAYLLFSLEYRHLVSSPVIGHTSDSNIIGVGAGYKF